MIAIAKAMTDAEIKASAEYFASLPYKQWIKVVEADKVLGHLVDGISPSAVKTISLHVVPPVRQGC
mgnify:CR=1 FL=1